MRRASWLLCLLLTVSLNAADPLADVLKHMDEAAARFKGLSASLSYTKVTVVVDDKTVESGMIYIQKEKGGKGYKVMIDFTSQPEHAVLVKDGEVRMSRPKIRQTEIYEVGKKKELLEQFMLLGFGGGGKELANAYGVTLAPDTTLDSEACVKLNLLPKGNMTRDLKSVELWLSRETWLPLQQKFNQPGGDYLTARYTHVKAEAQPDDRFKLNDKGFKVVHPGQ